MFKTIQEEKKYKLLITVIILLCPIQELWKFIKYIARLKLIYNILLLW